jgi:predicted enzyme related to lactoylglutathione lyase
VFAIFPAHTKYFEPSQSSFMINFRVENLDELLKALREEGVDVAEKAEDYDYGKFGWVMDPEGNRVELWEPKTVISG